MYNWNDLKEFIQKGEQFIETEEAHVAVLVARMMHADRAVSTHQAETVPAQEPADSAAPIVETPATPAVGG